MLMKHKAWLCLITACFAILLTITPAKAATLKVHITGPAKERAQYAGQAFVIGISASAFSVGWVEIQTPSITQVLPMECKKTNYLTYMPIEAGEYTITAVVTASADTKKKTSSVTLTVFPTDAQGRAAWMVREALSCVGSTDAEKFMQNTTLDAEDDWCAAFIGWCAKQVRIPDGAGLQAIFAGLNIYKDQTEPIQCKTCRDNYKARFLADVIGKDEPLQPGDLVFFIWDSKLKSQLKAHPGYLKSWHGNASHVGIVTSVHGDDFTFVHGNIRMKHNMFGVVLNQSTDERDGKTYADWVVGFGRPNYEYKKVDQAQ